MSRRRKTHRNFPRNTCPASRHVEIIADCLPRKGGYPMLTEEPEHCAESMRATVEALYACRTALQQIQALDPTSEAAQIARKISTNYEVFPDDLEADVAECGRRMERAEAARNRTLANDGAAS